MDAINTRLDLNLAHRKIATPNVRIDGREGYQAYGVTESSEGTVANEFNSLLVLER